MGMRAEKRLTLPGGYRLVAAALLTAAMFATLGCGGGTGTTRVVIPPGATFRVAADSLHRAGIVGSTRLFRMYASLRGHARPPVST